MSNPRESTPDRLQRCALELFSARGFDATTVNDIAAAAGVSHMTFFRYFPTKESVVMDDPYDPVIVEAVLAQPADVPTFERVRRGFLAAWAAVPEPADAATRARIALVAAHPGLRAASWANNRRTEDAVANALIADGVGRLEAHVAAAACLGALMSALLDWGAEDGGDPLGDRIRSALGHLAVRDGAVADVGVTS